MEIQNNYHSFSDRRYQQTHTHTHHITKCLLEEEYAQQKEMAAGMKQETLSSGGEGKAEQDGVFTYGVTREEGKKISGLKKGLGVIKGIWDSMGDEEKAVSEKGLVMGDRAVRDAGIDAASSAIRQGLPYRIVNKWEHVREKLKAGLSTALKRFNRGDTFAALTDPKGNFRRKKRTGGGPLERAGRGTRQKKPDILTATVSDSHLMDSYSKTGEYCQINENLTYHTKKAVENSPKS